jgi:hypothetical protein
MKVPGQNGAQFQVERNMYKSVLGKGKDIPVTGHEGP